MFLLKNVCFCWISVDIFKEVLQMSKCRLFELYRGLNTRTYAIFLYSESVAHGCYSQHFWHSSTVIITTYQKNRKPDINYPSQQTVLYCMICKIKSYCSSIFANELTSDQLFQIGDDGLVLVEKSKTYSVAGVFLPPLVPFSLLNPSFFVVTQDPEPLYKSCVENLVKELAMQKLAEPQVVEKKDWWKMYLLGFCFLCLLLYWWHLWYANIL